MTERHKRAMILKALRIPRTREELAALVGWGGLNKSIADLAGWGFVIYNQTTGKIEAVDVEVV